MRIKRWRRKCDSGTEEQEDGDGGGGDSGGGGKARQRAKSLGGDNKYPRWMGKAAKRSGRSERYLFSLKHNSI